MLFGAAFKNKGVQPLLDAVVDYLPSPVGHAAGQRAIDEKRATMSRLASASEPFSALAFKVMNDAQHGN